MYTFAYKSMVVAVCFEAVHSHRVCLLLLNVTLVFELIIPVMSKTGFVISAHSPPFVDTDSLKTLPPKPSRELKVECECLDFFQFFSNMRTKESLCSVLPCSRTDFYRSFICCCLTEGKLTATPETFYWCEPISHCISSQCCTTSEEATVPQAHAVPTVLSGSVLKWGKDNVLTN